MRMVVTGARGMLGTATVKYLRGLGIETVGTDSLAGTGEEEQGYYIRADLTEGAAIYDIADGADAIIHLAAIAAQRIYTARHTFFTNTQMTWNVLEAAARLKIPRVVVASSLQVNHTVLPHSPIRYEYFPVDEEHSVSPQDEYPLSKFVGEKMGDMFAHHWGLTVASLRFPLIANADNYARMPRPDMDVPFGALFAWVHLNDAARACHLAATAPLEPRSHTVFMVAARDSSLGAPTRDYLARHYPDSKIRPSLAEYGSTIDSSRAERLLGWVPEISVKR